jgi:alpha-tubulin suppressor-like RCC1 family protein
VRGDYLMEAADKIATAQDGTWSMPDAPQSNRRLAAGEKHSCAISSDGNLWCWGRNGHGQLGTGSVVESPVPTPVVGLQQCVSVATGEKHTCCVKENGEVACWGNNDWWQCGHTDGTILLEPVIVEGLSHVVGVSAGTSFTCALTAEGDVSCWGSNLWGEFGSPEAPLLSAEPYGVPVGNVTELASTANATCAAVSGEPVHCWGSLCAGGGFIAWPCAPGAIESGADLKSLAAGGNRAFCAIDKKGQVWQWRQTCTLYCPDSGSAFSVPEAVEGLPPAVSVACADKYGCAVDESGLVWCWGLDEDGHVPELGMPGTELLAVMPGLPPAVRTSIGHRQVCTLNADYQVWCWGGNQHGQAGGGFTGLSPLPVLFAGTGINIDVVASRLTCGLSANGGAQCAGELGFWGVDPPSPLPGYSPTPQLLTLPAGTIEVGIASPFQGEGHACALNEEGSIWCWGDNESGQLGDGSFSDSTEPVLVAGGFVASKVSAGVLHTCALDSQGIVWCWGDNAHGELGFSGGASSVPQPVPVAVPFQDLSASYGFTCAVDSGENVWCWGENTGGEMGTEPHQLPSSPAMVPGVPSVEQVACGVGHTCARDSQGQVWCWGSNSDGACGTPGTFGAVETARLIEGLPQVDLVATRGWTSYALTPDGRVYAWGWNFHGQLGDGSTVDSAIPREVVGIPPATAIAAGIVHACSLDSSGQVWCWGSNWQGQLGIGQYPFITDPIRVL